MSLQVRCITPGEREPDSAVPVRREPEPGRVWAEVPDGDRLDELLFCQKPARGRNGSLPQRRKRRELHGDPGGEVRLRPVRPDSERDQRNRNGYFPHRRKRGQLQSLPLPWVLLRYGIRLLLPAKQILRSGNM